MKYILSIALLLSIAVLSINLLLTTVVDKDKMITITSDIDSFRKLATKLEEEKVIKSKDLFYYTARIFLPSAVIYKGEYKVKSGTTMLNALLLFINYKNIHSYIVTIPEGSNYRQVIQILKKDSVLQGALPKAIPEGSLMPDTYYFERGTTYNDLINRMQVEQSRFLESVWESRAPDLPYNTKREAIILASMIEEETGISGERAKIAGVFVNRLRAGMRLQSDPTVAYGLGKDTADGLRKSELRSQNSYNTYTIRGLPIGPISNPGKDAILAALNPEGHNLYYFVADGKGGHIFAKTLIEHNKNVARWRVIERNRSIRNSNR